MTYHAELAAKHLVTGSSMGPEAGLNIHEAIGLA